MKLKNSLYQIEHHELAEDGARYDVVLNAAHVIYQAHFPGQPITPGVCIIQIAKELLEEFVGQSLDVRWVKNVKFLSVISPEATPRVSYRLQKVVQEADGYKAQVEVSSGDTAMAKISFFCAPHIS